MKARHAVLVALAAPVTLRVRRQTLMIRFIGLLAAGVGLAVGGSSAAAQGQPTSMRSPDVGESSRFVEVLPRAQYVARARAICTAGTKRLRAVERRLFGAPPYNPSTGTLAEWAAWHTAAARFTEEAMAELRGLPPPPKADRARLDTWFSLAERLPGLLRRIAAAASAGNAARYDALVGRRVRLTHEEDGIGYLPSQCPVALPA